LTDKAKDNLPAGRAVLHQGNAEMTAGMSAEEVALLVSLLQRVLANVDAMEAKAPPVANRDVKLGPSAHV
jgi:hypothetical protein